jgi:hypothetical protein
LFEEKESQANFPVPRFSKLRASRSATTDNDHLNMLHPSKPKLSKLMT